MRDGTTDLRSLPATTRRDLSESDRSHEFRSTEIVEDSSARLQQSRCVSRDSQRCSMLTMIAVLSLITLPNLMLAYAQHLTTLPPSLPTPSPIPQSLSAINEDVEDAQLNPSNDEPEPGELEITPEFLESFESFLSLENIEIRFFHGSWEGMEIVEGSGAATYDLILSSETIYSLSSLTSLLNLLRSACHSSLDDRGEMAMETRERSLCLIACKRIYFGVGGGEVEFTRRVEAMGGSVESVWGEGVGVGKSLGVGRVVMSVDWKK